MVPGRVPPPPRRLSPPGPLAERLAQALEDLGRVLFPFLSKRNHLDTILLGYIQEFSNSVFRSFH